MDDKPERQRRLSRELVRRRADTRLAPAVVLEVLAEQIGVRDSAG